jgi:hypothetical protein
VRRAAPLLGLAATLVALVGCGGGGDDNMVAPVASAALSAPVNVQPCLDQVVYPGRTLANSVVPDTIKVDLDQPSGFPNGRRLTDPVIDIEIAWLFLDVPQQGADVLAKIPLGPSANDRTFRADFPYLATPNGPGLNLGGQGSNFVFRTNPPSAYVQVDRMAMPAISTVVIGSSAKNAYNDDLPANDATRKYVNEITTTLTGLANALVDDWQGKGLKVCAVKATS